MKKEGFLIECKQTCAADCFAETTREEDVINSLVSEVEAVWVQCRWQQHPLGAELLRRADWPNHGTLGRAEAKPALAAPPLATRALQYAQRHGNKSVLLPPKVSPVASVTVSLVTSYTFSGLITLLGFY
ncbi:hypothetical protein SKAU_G00109910 [Synaphobranchus kaupii]|uniref:Uncharacterized protein n=1 Tax=Synaphobranchus kaupii TaxID=118154 RepID=A0A9Q1G101_SYNKA|nr:hypothetical protein SKAU_G00109910 [Synaphobranchus kaupii]